LVVNEVKVEVVVWDLAEGKDVDLLSVEQDGEDREKEADAEAVVDVPEDGHQEGAHPHHGVHLGAAQNDRQLSHLQEHALKRDQDDCRQNTLEKYIKNINFEGKATGAANEFW